MILKSKKVFRNILCALLCVALVLPCAVFASPVALAAEATYGGLGTKVADAPTVNDWKKFFGPDVRSTANAGLVWTDKSVFTSVADYTAATDEQEGADFGLTLTDPSNFLVSLSAIASTKSVEGYASLPSDSVLVLDLSASMVDGENRVAPMVQAANDAIDKLLSLNANNRVSVIAYSGNSQQGSSGIGTATVILPMGRYTAGLDGDGDPAYLVSSWTERSGNNRYVTRTGVKVAAGTTATEFAEGVDEDLFSANNSKRASGGTYIQNGVYKAWQQFASVTDPVVTDGLQAGVNRIPIMVLLSDGAPTAATNAYTNIGTSTLGDGTQATNSISFLTQLTMAWTREKMEEKYGEEPLIYTLGLGVSGDDNAGAVLDPSNNSATDGYWTIFKQGNGVSVSNNQAAAYVAPPVSSEWSEDYVTEYFPAANVRDMIDAFASIVERIIIQSLYYPTHISETLGIEHDGYLTFEDYIGKHMKVVDVKGLQLGSTLYTGQRFAKLVYEGGLGTESAPTVIGNEFVHSVQTRLGIADVTVARDLITKAYNAQQIYYNSATGEYRNTICWYAKADGTYRDFWDGKDTSSAPTDAVYAVCSYVYYDAVGEGHRQTDTMYASVQVRTTLKDNVPGKIDASKAGDVRMIVRMPASLIPLVEYHVAIRADDPNQPLSLTVTGAQAPSRLIYEVGLADHVDILDLDTTATDAKVNGDYVFYTNDWHLDGNGTMGDTVAAYTYGTNRNTVSYFSPSIENEHYYYNADTPIYSDTNGTLYTGSTQPQYDQNNLYYHRYTVYSDNGGTLSVGYEYEQLSQHVFAHAGDIESRTVNGNTYWVVTRGTLHHYYGTYIVEKGTERNYTKTLPVADMPFVHDVTAGVDPTQFHVDSYLGNNGRLTMEPADGIVVSKLVSGEVVDTQQSFPFTAKGDGLANVEFALILEAADGTRTASSQSFDENGEFAFTLRHGEKAYLISHNLIGKTIVVTEGTTTGYELTHVNGTTTTNPQFSLTVAADKIVSVEYKNGVDPTKIPTSVTITGSKKLTVNSGMRTLQAGAFSFGLYDANDTLLQTVTNDDPAADNDNDAFTAGFTFAPVILNEQGTFIYTVKEIVPADLQGVTYDASEYTVTVEVTDINNDNMLEAGTPTITLSGASATAIAFDNEYSVTSTSVTLGGMKTLQGGPMQSFSFELYEATLDPATQIISPVGNPIETVTCGSDGSYSFSSLTYSATGAHHYIIKEVVPTSPDPLMQYDPAWYGVEVSVRDNLQGQLVAVVSATHNDGHGNRTPVSATAPQSALHFTNLWKPEPVSIELTGVKNYNTTLAADAFSFELYRGLADASGAIQPVGEDLLTASNTAGDANNQGTFKFEETDVVDEQTGATAKSTYLTFTHPGTYHFVVKEVLPAGVTDANPTLNGITYDTTAHVVTVEVTQSDVNGRATLAAQVSTASGTPLAFTNSYNVGGSVSATITAEKSYTGANLTDGLFTFELYDAQVDDTTGVVTWDETTPRDTKTNVGKDVTFDAISYNSLADVKTHTYVVKEQIPTVKEQYVTYDESIWLVSVTVSDNGDGTLQAAAPVYALLDADKKATAGSAAATAAFRNAYVPPATPSPSPTSSPLPTVPATFVPIVSPTPTPMIVVTPAPAVTPAPTPTTFYPPDTGDAATPALWLLALAAALCAMPLCKRKAEKK